jgi:hypothetical protein
VPRTETLMTQLGTSTENSTERLTSPERDGTKATTKDRARVTREDQERTDQADKVVRTEAMMMTTKLALLFLVSWTSSKP